MIHESDFFGDFRQEAVNSNGPLLVGVARCHLFTSTGMGWYRSLPDPTGLRWLRAGGPVVYVMNRGVNSVQIRDHLGNVVTTVATDKGCVIVLSDEDTPSWHASCFDLYVGTVQTTTPSQTGTATTTTASGTTTSASTSNSVSTSSSSTASSSTTSGSGTPSAGTDAGEYGPEHAEVIGIEEGL